jgi:hypothetical protein
VLICGMDWVNFAIASGLGVTIGILLGMLRREDPPRKIVERVGADAIASVALVAAAFALTTR